MHKPPNESPYESYGQQNLLLRDYLAMDRTALANERTFLAYIRTALALVVVGGTLLHFFDSLVLEGLGIVFIACGALAGVIGFVRFQQTFRMIRALKQKPTLSEKPESAPAAVPMPEISSADEPAAGPRDSQ